MMETQKKWLIPWNTRVVHPKNTEYGLPNSPTKKDIDKKEEEKMIMFKNSLRPIDQFFWSNKNTHIITSIKNQIQMWIKNIFTKFHKTLKSLTMFQKKSMSKINSQKKIQLFMDVTNKIKIKTQVFIKSMVSNFYQKVSLN